MDGVIQRNLQYIFHNRINRNHFLVAPDPDYLIAQIDAILQSRNKLDQVLREGRVLLGQEYSRSQLLSIVDEIGALAKNIKAAFFKTFVEGHVSRYSVLYPVTDDPAAQFAYFLVQSQRISLELDHQFEKYFFAVSPGAVNLNDYEGNSIGTLLESLEELSSGVGKRLP
jgi:hypothetical protein